MLIDTRESVFRGAKQRAILGADVVGAGGGERQRKHVAELFEEEP